MRSERGEIVIERIAGRGEVNIMVAMLAPRSSKLATKSTRSFRGAGETRKPGIHNTGFSEIIEAGDMDSGSRLAGMTARSVSLAY